MSVATESSGAFRPTNIDWIESQQDTAFCLYKLSSYVAVEKRVLLYISIVYLYGVTGVQGVMTVLYSRKRLRLATTHPL